MAFWDNVNAGLKKAMDEGWTAVRDSARIGKSRYRLHTLHKQAETLFTEIGGIVYDMAESEDENPLSRPEVRDLIDDIKRIEAQSAEIEAEIEQTREKGGDDGIGGAEEGAWPAAVSKEAYGDEDEDEDDVVVVAEPDSCASAEEPEAGYDSGADDLDDDTLAAAGDPQPDDFGDGVEVAEEAEADDDGVETDDSDVVGDEEARDDETGTGDEEAADTADEADTCDSKDKSDS